MSKQTSSAKNNYFLAFDIEEKTDEEVSQMLGVHLKKIKTWKKKIKLLNEKNYFIASNRCKFLENAELKKEQSKINSAENNKLKVNKLDLIILNKTKNEKIVNITSFQLVLLFISGFVARIIENINYYLSPRNRD